MGLPGSLLSSTAPVQESTDARPDVGEVGLDEATAKVPVRDFVVTGGANVPEIRVPRNELLVFRARVALGPLEATAGKVELAARVVPYREGLLVPTDDAPGAQRETAEIEVHAVGQHDFYSLDATILTRHLPKDWPRVSYRQTQAGSENRRRELLVGRKEGVETVSYRKDTTDGAPAGTRIWRKPRSREIPEGAVDMLTAVMLVRTLIQDDLEEMRFPLLDKLHIWEMRLRRGERKRMQTRAGTFDVVEIVLEPEPYPDEDVDEERERKFEGLLGIRGSIHLWVEESSGVPVRIQGDLPAGILELGIDVELERYEGTPESFRPVGSK